jgi:hypothetical protein
MKRNLTLLFVLMVLAVSAAACSSTSAGGASTAFPTAGTPGVLPGISLDSTSRLALGTLLLEDTQLAVQEQQAAELLPLWQVYLNLSSSDTAAQVEMDGLQAQIRSTMMAEQLATIDEMQVDETDMRQLLESLGLSTGFGEWAGAQGTPAAGLSGTPISGMGGGRGDMPPGGFIFGEGGGGGMGEQGGMAMDGRADPSLQATRQAGMPSRQLGGGNPMLVRAVIDLLQRKLPAAEG